MPKSPNCPNYYVLGVSGTHDQPGNSATTAQGSCHGVFVQGLLGFWNLGLLGGGHSGLEQGLGDTIAGLIGGDKGMSVGSRHSPLDLYQMRRMVLSFEDPYGNPKACPEILPNVGAHL